MRQIGLQAVLIAAFTVVLVPKAIAQSFSGDWLFGTTDPVVIHVSVECGNDDWTGLSPDCAAPDGPKATIQAGLNAALTGDTVLVADGAGHRPQVRPIEPVRSHCRPRCTVRR